LAGLCEALGSACLNIGTPEHWTRAEELFNQAIELRGELKKDLRLQIEVSEERDIEALFQLARVRTHRRELDEAEKRYLDLLQRPLVQAKLLLRAHILKELADNYRFAENQDQMERYFRQALEGYEAARRKQAPNDPIARIEVCLNIGYCHRRLGDETAALAAIQEALELAHARRDRRRVAYSCLQLARSPVMQEEPEQAAIYALVAREMMQASHAQADRAQAESLLNELLERTSPEKRGGLGAEAKKSQFGIYLDQEPTLP
jgi:tetratricopeptide (TPR) repeat protein